MQTRNSVIFLVVLLMMIVAGGWAYVNSHFAINKPIRYVKVEGAFQYINKDRLKELVAAEMKRGFYQADMRAVHEAISQLPLVEQVDVKRVWPDAVYIRVVEHKPVVRWGEKALLNNQGNLLIPDNIEDFKTLPLVTGPEGQEKKLLEVMKGIYIVLKDKSMQMAEFHVNERRSWRIKLVTGMEMQLGRKAPLENMQRFLKVMDLMGEQVINAIASVDTRYPNGFAITWKPDTAIDWRAIVANTKT